jgi:hypothetical protein
LTSTIDVDQHWRRHRPVRAKRTSSSPNAVTVPMRLGSATSAAP